MGRGRDSEKDLSPTGTCLCPPAPGDQAAQLYLPPLGLWDLEGILGGSNLTPHSPEPCDPSWLLCTCSMGFLEVAFGLRLWGRRRRKVGQVPCSFLKPPSCSPPASCEDTSEGSGGGGGQ